MARKCVLCKKEYEYCPNCSKDSRKPLWHKLYCSDNCHNIFEALNNFNFELTTKEETQEILSKCNLTLELNDHYRDEINEIMAKPEANIVVEEPKSKKVKYQPKNKVEEASEEPNGVVNKED